jgi:ParB family chromosome partitioning protein
MSPAVAGSSATSSPPMAKAGGSMAIFAMDLAAKKLAHEAEVAELGSKLAWVKPTLATHVTYDETKDLHAYWPRRAEPSAEAQARMDEISDRMTEIAEILDAPDDGDDVEALEAEYNALDAEHDRLLTPTC